MSALEILLSGRVLLFCGLGLLLAGCKQDEAQQQNGAVYCVESAPTSMNPQLYGQGTLGSSLSHQVYDRLLTINPATQRLEGALANSWTISRDGLVYTFNLRKDVQFHRVDWFTPSRSFTAEDVLFSFNRMRMSSHPYHDVSGGRYPFFDNTGFNQQISDIRKLGDYQVQFQLNAPNASFLANLASDYAVILSAEYGQALLLSGHPEQLDQLAVGTGPFMQQEFRDNEFIRLHRNPLYWDQPVALERLAFDYTPRPTKRLAKLLTGECQVMAFPAASQLNFIRRQPNLQVDEESALNTAFLALNVQKKPFTDLRVRQAIAMGINRDNLLKAVYFGTGEWANTLLPPISWAHNPNVAEYSYDPIAAKALLKKAGLESGFEMTLWVQPANQTYNPNAQKTAQLIQSDLARLGIQVHVAQLRGSLIQALLQEGRHDAVVLGWNADTADPDSFFRPLLSCRAMQKNGSNYSRWCDTEFDHLLEQAISTTRMAERIADYQKMQEMVYQDVPLIPLGHSQYLYAGWKNLHNLELTPMGGLSFKRAYRE
jgi:cationic peptide transport system substrate-binding protein